MVEIVVILGNSVYSFEGTHEKGDSVVKKFLLTLADKGYPFAKANVYIERYGYYAIIYKGPFYVLSDIFVVGDFTKDNVEWIFKGVINKPFRYKDIIRIFPVLEFYSMELSVLRGKGRMVFDLRSKKSSEVIMVLSGNRNRLKGYADVGIYNFFGLPSKVYISGDFDTSRVYIDSDVDIPQNGFIPAGVFINSTFISGYNGMFYYIGLHRWFSNINAGIGYGGFGKYFSVFRVMLLGRMRFEGTFMFSLYGYGAEINFKWGFLRAKAFKGIYGLKKPFGGFEGFREISRIYSLRDNFLVSNLDIPVYKGGVVVGPYMDILLSKGFRPGFSKGLFLKFEMFEMFISSKRNIGFMLKLTI